MGSWPSLAPTVRRVGYLSRKLALVLQFQMRDLEMMSRPPCNIRGLDGSLVSPQIFMWARRGLTDSHTVLARILRVNSRVFHDVLSDVRTVCG